MKIGRALAAGAVFLLLVTACAPPPKTIQVFVSPTPSSAPSPTPTVPVGVGAPPFHRGEVGLAYVQVTLTASGGLAPYKWTVASGELPGGLTLGNDGSISGTPTASGDFAFTIQVADSGDSSAKIDGKISIAAALSASLVPGCAQYCNVELGCTNACGNFGGLSGGLEPYTFSLTQGTLPAGTSLSELSLVGTFGGAPGWLQFTVQVSDALGATSSISPKFWMYPHISLGSGSCVGGFNTGCQTQLLWSGGTPGDTATVSIASISQYCGATGCWPVSPLPAGYGLTVSGGSVLVSIPQGIMNGYHAVWTLTLTDASPCSSSAHCRTQATVTLVVAPG